MSFRSCEQAIGRGRLCDGLLPESMRVAGQGNEVYGGRVAAWVERGPHGMVVRPRGVCAASSRSSMHSAADDAALIRVACCLTRHLRVASTVQVTPIRLAAGPAPTSTPAT